MKSRLLTLGVVVLVYVMFALTFYNKTVSRYSDIINDYTEVVVDYTNKSELAQTIQDLYADLALGETT